MVLEKTSIFRWNQKSIWMNHHTPSKKKAMDKIVGGQWSHIVEQQQKQTNFFPGKEPTTKKTNKTVWQNGNSLDTNSDPQYSWKKS